QRLAKRTKRSARAARGEKVSHVVREHQSRTNRHQLHELTTTGARQNSSWARRQTNFGWFDVAFGKIASIRRAIAHRPWTMNYNGDRRGSLAKPNSRRRFFLNRLISGKPRG